MQSCVIEGREAVMVRDRECDSWARECVRLAGLADDPETREQLLNMAREWIAVVMQENELPDPKPLLGVNK
jgi:hypothetical protein